MKFKKEIKTIFLDHSFNGVIQNDIRLNIILSPSLYWVKKVTLPVKFVRDAIKFLPSIFEDQLLEGEYKYFAYKYNDEFIAFAYDEKKILKLLKSKGISKANIENIYFAQSEFSNLKNAVKINKDEVLYVKDDIVIILPALWIKNRGNLDLQNLKLSKHSVELTRFGTIINKKSFYQISVILALFALLNGFEYFTTIDKMQDIADKKDTIFLKHNLKPTLFQNRSLLKKYTA